MCQKRISFPLIVRIFISMRIVSVFDLQPVIKRRIDSVEKEESEQGKSDREKNYLAAMSETLISVKRLLFSYSFYIFLLFPLPALGSV